MGEVVDFRAKPVQLPVGVERFHRRAFVNYQLNRAHALGFADRAELYQAAGRIRSAHDAVAVFESLSMRAVADGRVRQATCYLRLAEFFTPPRSPEKQIGMADTVTCSTAHSPVAVYPATRFPTPGPRCPPTRSPPMGRVPAARCFYTAGSIP